MENKLNKEDPAQALIKHKSLINTDELKAILHYTPNTGLFTWKISRGCISVGKVAGSLNSNTGYICIRINRKAYSAHRLAWFYVHGTWSSKQLDHINGVKTDNRILNLREASCSQNNCNKFMRRDNKSGVKGVSWSRIGKKWIAQCRVNGKNHYLGYFSDITDAERVVRKFREEFHKEFANHE